MILLLPRRWSERHWRVKDAGKQGLAADDADRIDVLRIAVPRQFLVEESSTSNKTTEPTR